MDEKNGRFYPNGFTLEMARGMRSAEGTIRNPIFRILTRDYLRKEYKIEIKEESIVGLEFEVSYENARTRWPIANELDIKSLTEKAGESKLLHFLRGQKIDVYIDDKNIVRGISF